MTVTRLVAQFLPQRIVRRIIADVGAAPDGLCFLMITGTDRPRIGRVLERLEIRALAIVLSVKQFVSEPHRRGAALRSVGGVLWLVIGVEFDSAGRPLARLRHVDTTRRAQLC